MKRSYQFTTETQDLITDLEKKYKRKKKKEKKITQELLDFVNALIGKYDELFSDRYSKSQYTEICICGQTYEVLPEMIRELKEVIKAVGKNSFDNMPVYRCIEENGEMKRVKTFKQYRIQRLAKILKVAREADYALFESFIKIPDVYYTLNVIKSNKFGELDKYFGLKSG